MTTVVVVTAIAAPTEVVFDLALDMDGHAAALARSGETFETSTGHPVLGLGDVVHFRARHFGLPFRLSAQVVELDRPHRFADEQVRGPFAALRHEHVFEARDGGTTMTDRLVFRAPLGAFGAVVARLVLAGHLRRLLVVRNAHLLRTAEAVSDPDRPGPPPR